MTLSSSVTNEFESVTYSQCTFSSTCYTHSSSRSCFIHFIFPLEMVLSLGKYHTTKMINCYISVWLHLNLHNLLGLTLLTLTNILLFSAKFLQVQRAKQQLHGLWVSTEHGQQRGAATDQEEIRESRTGAESCRVSYKEAS